MILVSSCLAGEEVRYDGKHCLHSKIKILVQENKAITICPELLGGFSVPREPAEIIGGDGYDVLDGMAKVISKTGEDVTNLYLKGAYYTLERAEAIQATTIVLKENSPSCGSSMIYNGTFKGEKIAGSGVTSALLKRKGYQIMTEEQFMNELD